jgi:hypothetical protein
MEGSASEALRRRQRRQIGVLAWVLLIAGAAILLFLDRIPLPVRLLMGFVDLVAGAGLLVLRRQKFTEFRKTSPR